MSRAADLIVEVLDGQPDGLCVSELARRVDRHDGNVRRVLGKLKEAGLVDRVAGSGRQVLWYRTDNPAPPAPKRPAEPEPRVVLPREVYLRLKAEAHRTGRSLKSVTADALVAQLLDEKESKETTAA